MRAHDTNRLITSMAATQHGMFTTAEAVDAGISRHALARRVQHGMLDRPAPGLYRIAGSASTWEQRAAHAVELAGPDASLSHRTAALLWILDGFDRAPMEVLVRHGTSRKRWPGVRVHESRSLAECDLTTRRGLPVTNPVRTILDLATVAHPFRVEQAMEDGLRRDLFTTQQLAQRYTQIVRRGWKGGASLRQMIEFRLGERVPTGSAFELKVLKLLLAHGLPEPVRQHPVTLAADLTVYLDLAWPRRQVALECDGIWDHGTNRQLPWDADRQNQVQLLGWLVLRTCWRFLHDHPLDLVSMVTSALDERS